jgi:CubicO group peptidase (beta-lactamase class C family)
MVVRHGRVVAEGWWGPYAPGLNHTMYSMSKSFTSTAIGFAVAEGRLTVEDPVLPFFPDARPKEVSENLAALRVKHLLTMAAGHAKDTTLDIVREEDWVRAFLALPIVHPPGSAFLYNSGATYMLSAIVQHLTGQKTLDYLTPRLFEPLGITGATWEVCPRGINTGGWGLGIRTEGLAKFGQLYLQKGAWQGRQILPASWAEEATTFKIQQPTPANPSRPNAQNDWLQGYCYQFWRSTHRAFRGDGAYGQFTIMMPDQDAVVVITGESSNLQGELDLVWEHLFTAMNEAPLPADAEGQVHLQRKIASLALNPPPGQDSSPLAHGFSGRTFKLEPNESGLQTARFTFQPGACLLTLSDAQAQYPLVCGIGRWERSETALPGTPPRLVSGGAPPRGTKAKVAGSATWKDEHTLELTWRYIETPHHDTVTCRFGDASVSIAFLSSIAQLSSPPKDKRRVLEGKLA